MACAFSSSTPRSSISSPALDSQLLSICYADVPLMKDIPRRQAPLFARTWSSLLNEALARNTPTAWFEYACFPKCILLAQIRAVSWSENKSALWQGVLARCERGKSKKVPSPLSRFREKSAWSVTSWRRPQSTSVFCCGPYCPQDPGNFSGSQRAPPALPTPRSNPRCSHIPGATRSFSSVLLLPHLLQGCLVIALLSYSNVPEQNPSISCPP